MNIKNTFTTALNLQRDQIRVAKGIKNSLEKGAIKPSDISDSYEQTMKTEKMSRNPIKRFFDFINLYVRVLKLPQRQSRFGEIIKIPTPTKEQIDEINKLVGDKPTRKNIPFLNQ